MPETWGAVFWLGVLQIIAIDVLLGGDNAVVIALASRGLPVDKRSRAIFWGVFGAIALRIGMIFFAIQLLELPYLKSVGALLLIWIGVKLLQPEPEDEHTGIQSSTKLIGAIRTIIMADAAMSLDNVIAVAGAAKGHLGLVVFGILFSVPIIVFGSRLVLLLMDRFPIAITIGGGLLGWIAGAMLFTDPALAPLLHPAPAWQEYAAHLAGAVVVVALGSALARRTGRGKLVDLAGNGAAEAPRARLLRKEKG